MKRQPFSPARLVLGLSLLAIALLHVMEVTDRWQVPLYVLLALLPAALVLTGLTAVVTQLVRHRRGRRTVPAAPRSEPRPGSGRPSDGSG